jgi:hypothetical protein
VSEVQSYRPLAHVEEGKELLAGTLGSMWGKHKNIVGRLHLGVPGNFDSLEQTSPENAVALFLWRSWWLCNQNKNKPSWKQAAQPQRWPLTPLKGVLFMPEQTAEISVGWTCRHIILFLPCVSRRVLIDEAGPLGAALACQPDQGTRWTLVECGGKKTTIVSVCVLRTVENELFIVVLA